ncbi:unnamed protein product [marine sediment metagenome]|uniref:Uncharacterized protein n=1 Tax=marine sediment metagenome TaxID=412755 RepID=X1BMI7_9ZZZZ
MPQVRPDDPAWLSVEPDIRLVDLQVLRQAGVPEPLLFLALREKGPVESVGPGAAGLGNCHRYLDLSYLDEFEEDPDKRPYTWDLPEDDIP